MSARSSGAGEPLVRGKTVTGFANVEEDFAIRDANLVTGEQNFSGAEVAQTILEAVGR